MSTITTETSASTPSGMVNIGTNERGHGRRRGNHSSRGRGGRNPTRNVRTSNMTNSHAPVTANSTIEDQISSNGSQNRDRNVFRRDRGNRGNGRNRTRAMRSGRPTHATDATHVPERSFGGQLTTNEESDPQQTPRSTTQGTGAHLRADAAEFVPGKLHSGTTKSTSNRHANRPAKTKSKSKSTAPDFPTRIHQDINNGVYECPICTSEIGRKSRVWACHQCWTVFHLGCVKKWSENEGSSFTPEEGRSQTSRQWRCPGCNLPQDGSPTTYSCWCGKEIDPRPLPGLPPHSCGQTCSRSRKGCPHPCDFTCHAGPCPPCTAMGPTQDCFCGKQSSRKRCVETDYENGWSCGVTCGDLLPCGKHTCTRPCHEGLCGSCDELVDATCYCGRVRKEMPCSELDEEITSEQRQWTDSGESTVRTWTGVFRCDNTCERSFDCGVHSCQKPCHPQDIDLAHCPLSPDVVSHCPCGKTPLSQIPDIKPRTSCQDPVPNCTEPCSRSLPCGHPCPRICHTGSCPPCLRTVTIQCRCGRSSFSTVCHQGKEEPPQCMRICKATLNCGRHACSERCCTGERKAAQRQATKRKLRSLNVGQSGADEVEAEHICTRVCGRTLKCGRHTCPELCHKGPCGSCREAIFDEVTCHCGRSVLQPPLPCGTKPPPCQFECERPKECGHPQTPHNCHTDDEPCPKCPFLTEKKCVCGKQILKNQPCWRTEVSCGLTCGIPLKCGFHTCQRQCHRPGECEDATSPCRQRCGKAKQLCGHPCTDPCHAPSACPESEPCSTSILVSCACGRIRQERRCNAARAVILKGQTLRPETLPTTGPIECDEECARLERNRSFANALNIDIDQKTTISHAAAVKPSVSNLPYSAETMDIYRQVFSTSTSATIHDYETTLHNLAASPTQRSVRFQPARAALRAFVHSLAADWGFPSESFDPEPHRHVFVLKPSQWTPPPLGFRPDGSSIGIGGMTVGECIRFRDRELAKEREAQQAAAQAKSGSNVKTPTPGDIGDGWAQVAYRKRVSPNGGTPLQATLPGSPMFSQTVYSALGKDREQSSSPKPASSSNVRSLGKAPPVINIDDVADDWEEQVEKEEQAEREMAKQDFGDEKVIENGSYTPAATAVRVNE
ncbi:hypothetical protein VTN31DRAFT_3822 [Thermomyces dupontii]|uniref:uncharacterized protein n=1 Tax=Talaromyces thermophilus TaxID=28565 RepID=UPI00374411AA